MTAVRATLFMVAAAATSFACGVWFLTGSLLAGCVCALVVMAVGGAFVLSAAAFHRGVQRLDVDAFNRGGD